MTPPRAVDGLGSVPRHAAPLQGRNMREIEGKTAVVTGGASGIGLAMVRHFAQAGMKVMIADIQPGPLRDAIAALRGEGLEVSGCETDVTKPESVEDLARATVRAYGGVHLLCNNAGI